MQGLSKSKLYKTQQTTQLTSNSDHIWFSDWILIPALRCILRSSTVFKIEPNPYKPPSIHPARWVCRCANREFQGSCNLVAYGRWDISNPVVLPLALTWKTSRCRSSAEHNPTCRRFEEMNMDKSAYYHGKTWYMWDAEHVPTCWRVGEMNMDTSAYSPKNRWQMLALEPCPGSCWSSDSRSRNLCCR